MEGHEYDQNHGIHIGSFICICLMIGTCFAGCLGNFLAFLVFVRPNFRPAVLSTLLAAKSIADLLLLCFSTPVWLVQTEYLNGGRYASYVDYLSAVLLLYAGPVAAILRTTSMCLLLLLVWERWLKAFRPTAHAAHLTKSHTVLAVASVGMLSVLWNLARFWEHEWREGGDSWRRRLLAEPAYVVAYATVAYTLTHYLLPVPGAALLSACVCRSATPGATSPSQTFVGSPDHEEPPPSLPPPSSRERRGNQTVVFLVLVYGVSYFLHFFLVVMEGADGGHGPRGPSAGLALAGDVSRVLVLFGAAAGPFGYALLNLHFRREAKWYFLICCLKRADRESEFTRSMRNLDRREGGSIRMDNLSRSQRNALRGSKYGKRLAERKESQERQSLSIPPVLVSEFHTLDEESPVNHI